MKSYSGLPVDFSSLSIGELEIGCDASCAVAQLSSGVISRPDAVGLDGRTNSGGEFVYNAYVAPAEAWLEALARHLAGRRFADHEDERRRIRLLMKIHLFVGDLSIEDLGELATSIKDQRAAAA